MNSTEQPTFDAQQYFEQRLNAGVQQNLGSLLTNTIRLDAELAMARMQIEELRKENVILKSAAEKPQPEAAATKTAA